MFKFFTTRLTISLVNFSDLEDIHKLLSLPETDEFNTLGIPKGIDKTQEIVNSMVIDNNKNTVPKDYTFSIYSIDNKDFIGLIGFKVSDNKFKVGEVWYKLHLDYWRKGFATEAVKEILRFGFDHLNLHRIQAGCAVKNIGSIRVIEKAGMKLEGRKRKSLPLKSGWSDSYEFGILISDWLSQNNLTY